jgi:multiple sugar transport system substrate-binding protein
MRIQTRRGGKAAWTLLAALALTACGQGTEKGPEQAGTQPADESKEKKAVTVSMYIHANILDEADLNKYVIGPLKEKLPHVTLEVTRDGKGYQIQDVLSTGSFPDLIVTSNPHIPTFKDAALATDIAEYVRKQKIDLNAVDPALIEAIRMNSPTGELYGLPFRQNLGVLVSNLDLFDKFGLPYPTDGMSFDDVLEVGKKLTRMDGGTHYIGFDPGNVPNNMSTLLALPFADPKTHKAVFDSEGWRTVFDFLKSAYEVPNFIGPNKEYQYASLFATERRVAMQNTWVLGVAVAASQGNYAGMKWDMVSSPNFKGHVGKGREADVHLMMLSKLSKQPEAAMEVMNMMLSMDVQSMFSRDGRPGVLNHKEIEQQFASGIEAFKGKNIAGIFKSKPIRPHEVSPYDAKLRSLIESTKVEFILGGKDLNTYVRDLQEKADQTIEAMRKQ